MLTAVAVIASLALTGWLIYRGVRQLPIRPHTVVRAIAYLTGLFTYAYFLSMDFPLLIKVDHGSQTASYSTFGLSILRRFATIPTIPPFLKNYFFLSRPIEEDRLPHIDPRQNISYEAARAPEERRLPHLPRVASDLTGFRR